MKMLDDYFDCFWQESNFCASGCTSVHASNATNAYPQGTASGVEAQEGTFLSTAIIL